MLTPSLSVSSIHDASARLTGVAAVTPLQESPRLSARFGARVYVKREDLQEVRSYKIRGAYAFMSMLSPKERTRGAVCASAGNHAQGVAWSCARLKTKGVIFMPVVTPLQKINRVRYFGGAWADVRLVGAQFDDANAAALAFAKRHKAAFIHPFDDPRVMSGQGTVGKEIVDVLGGALDAVICPIGGGGLIAGVGTYAKAALPRIRVIGAEPAGAASMRAALRRGRPVSLPTVDTFVDGAAVRRVGTQTFAAVRRLADEVVVVPEGEVCSAMIDLYQQEGIVAEPAGALAVAALERLGARLRGKTVVCVLSGGNNDILRYPEIMERSLIHRGLRHYVLVEFAQKPGQLKRLINEALGPADDIVRFEYMKKNNKETGPALVGIETAARNGIDRFARRLSRLGIRARTVERGDPLLGFLL